MDVSGTFSSSLWLLYVQRHSYRSCLSFHVSACFILFQYHAILYYPCIVQVNLVIYISSFFFIFHFVFIHNYVSFGESLSVYMNVKNKFSVLKNGISFFFFFLKLPWPCRVFLVILQFPYMNSDIKNVLISFSVYTNSFRI